MPRKPADDLFEQFAQRMLEKLVFPALEDRLFPLVDQLLGPRPEPAPRKKPQGTVRPPRKSLPRLKRPPAFHPPRPVRAFAPTLYDELQVSPRASQEVIHAAYRSLSLLHHPDRNQGSKSAEERFKRIAGAYEILSDAQKRAAYDRSLHA